MRLSFCAVAVVLFGVAMASSDEDASSCHNVAASTLKQVIIVLRHGARTPRASFPTDKQLDYWDRWGGLNQQTQVGHSQVYQLGKWFRHCYDDFLGNEYNAQTTYARSTDTDRALTGGEGYLAGVYDPEGRQEWKSGHDALGKLWQPVPLHAVDYATDYLLNSNADCPALTDYVDEKFANSDTNHQLTDEYQDQLETISHKAGYAKTPDFKTIGFNLGDYVKVANENRLKLPSWFDKSAVQCLLQWRHLWVKFTFGDDQSVKLSNGQLVEAIIDSFAAKSKGKSTLKHIVYSGHDGNVAGILGAYGNYPKKVSNYASAVITELHQDPHTHKYFVKAFYRDPIANKLVQLKIRHCGEHCSLRQFATQLKDVRLEDRAAACKDH